MLFVNVGAFAGDCLYIDEFTIKAGESKTIAVNFDTDNEDHYTMFQFDLDLPEGVSVVTNSKGKYVQGTSMNWNTNRIEDHTLSANKLASGKYRFLGATLSLSTLYGKSGPLMYVNIVADKSITGGVVEAKISGVIFDDTKLEAYSLADTTVDVTVVSPKFIAQTTAPITLEGVTRYFGTIYTASTVIVPESVNVYTVSEINSELAVIQKVEGSIIPPGAYLIASSTALSNIVFEPSVNTPVAIGTNLLLGSTEKTIISEKGYLYFILNEYGGSYGFFFQDKSCWAGTSLEGKDLGSGVVNMPYGAYLAVKSTSMSKGFNLAFSKPNGIIKTNVSRDEIKCYDLSGHLMRGVPERGIYIEKGRVIYKN